MPDCEQVERSASKSRTTWNRGIEFILACIAMSVGLGNVWRFPYVAYKNGGGAFLIPYLVVLFLIAKPIYFMEMIMGQFSSKGCVKVYSFAPALSGIGIGQTFTVALIMTYYSALMAIILYYFFGSFFSTLPWSVCDPSWTNCFSSSVSQIGANNTGKNSSAEIFFLKTVIRETVGEDESSLNWQTVLCLTIAWMSIYFVVIKGIKSTGKAVYFLATFPYVIMITLLIRVLILPGAMDGVLHFITPNFGELLKLTVWFEAISQAFFSLSICFGAVIMYSSYNNFRQNIHRDVLIVTTMDMFTSVLSGFITFGVLGNLSAETNGDLTTMVKSGPSLVFLTYPEALSKFEFCPQLFSSIFFLMLYILSIGSISPMISCIATVVKDKFPSVKHWHVVTTISICGYLMALIYLKPGGMNIIDVVDRYGVNLVVYVLGIAQVVGVCWVYGVRKFCNDVEFMLKRHIGFYWRICWAFFTPMILICVFIYAAFFSSDLIKSEDSENPLGLIISGWLLFIIGIISFPICVGYEIYKRRYLGMPNMIFAAFRPTDSWGPDDLSNKKEWLEFVGERESQQDGQDDDRSLPMKIYDRLLRFLGY